MAYLLVLSTLLVCHGAPATVDNIAAEPSAGEYDAAARLERLKTAFEQLEQADVETVLWFRFALFLLGMAAVAFLLYAGYRLVEYCGPHVGNDSERRDHSWIVLVLFFFVLCYVPLSWVLAALVACWVSKVFRHLRNPQGDE